MVTLQSVQLVMAEGRGFKSSFCQFCYFYLVGACQQRFLPLLKALSWHVTTSNKVRIILQDGSGGGQMIIRVGSLSTVPGFDSCKLFVSIIFGFSAVRKIMTKKTLAKLLK